jgi:hypothetical protein
MHVLAAIILAACFISLAWMPGKLEHCWRSSSDTASLQICGNATYHCI